MTNRDNNGDHRARPLSFSLVCLGIIARILPHWPNFTPVGASALFAGARLRGWKAFAVPLLAMTASDPILSAIYGFSPFGWITIFVYGSFLVNVLIGRSLRKTISPLRILPAAGLGSVQFFLITNFGVWMLWHSFPHTFAGLVACYVAGLPFFGATLLGDLAYAAGLFASHAWLSSKVFSAERVNDVSTA